MNKDLEKVIEQIGKNIYYNTFCFKIEKLIKDCSIYQTNQVDSLVKYKDYSIKEIIELTKIERLFDLNIINQDEMKKILEEYKEYKELTSKNSNFILEQFYGKVSEKETLDKEIYLRIQELENNLNYYGILEELNFENAILDTIDNDLNKNIKKKKKF